MIVQLLQPLRMGARTQNVSRSSVLSAVAFFAALIWCWHVFGPSSYRIRKTPSLTSTTPGHIKPRYWSASQLGGLEGISTWQRPAGLNKIVGLVFYGRPATVSILDCYLKRNLVKNGGMLDEVVWIVRTNNTEHLAWLEVLLQTEEAYTKWNVTYTKNNDYRTAYDRIENGTMYVKMDDDIVSTLNMHSCESIVVLTESRCSSKTPSFQPLSTRSGIHQRHS
jgi:hypothetical protein